MDYFSYKNGSYYCEDVSLLDVAKKFGTPLYVYSEKTIEKHCLRFKEAFSSYPSYLCSFAVKACSNLSILKKIFSLGFGADVVSIGEIKKALLVGLDPKKIVFSGVSKKESELIEAINIGIRQFNVESLFELEKLKNLSDYLKVPVSVSLRINPNIDAHTHPKITTGLSSSKFGIREEDIDKFSSILSDSKYLNLIGISCHIGSQIKELSPIKDSVDRLVKIYNSLKQKHSTLSSIDIGGGVGIRYDDESIFSLEDYAHTVIDAISGTKATLILEPGRVIIGNTSVLLTEVVGIKEKKDKGSYFVMVDAGMNDLVRPAMYGSFHDIVPVKQHPCSCGCKDKNEECSCSPECSCGCNKNNYTFVGPICESSDVFGKDRKFPDLAEKDLIAIRSAGAYGMSMSSNYNSRELLAEVLVSGSEARLIRKRQSFDEMIALEKDYVK